VGVLALRRCTAILAPILLALILVIAVHQLIGILRRREAAMWPAATVTLIVLVAVILRLAASLALSVAQLFQRARGQRDRDLGRLPAEPVRFAKALGCRRHSWPRWVQHASRRRFQPQPPNWARTSAPLANALSMKNYDKR
jgi:hypothetical protein